MDVAKVLSDLIAYKAQLDEAIAILDRLAHQRGKRGRPVGVPSARRTVSPEARQRMAAAQRKRWAAARKLKAVKSKS
ncbi:MAG: hypothetical protein ABI833_02850 [Acidobacteriota bacterium]